MLQSNALPDIFAKKENKKEKKNKMMDDDYIVHYETSNTSFLKMYKLLEMLGVKNNDFFLAIYDERLINIDPYDPDLTVEEQALILAECRRNYWYFIREIVRIPVAGADIGTGIPYALQRGNLALSWCALNNLDFFLELPRQNGKSISIDIFLLWLYNFGTTNSSMLIMNKSHDDAKDNLGRIREIRDILPKYMRFNTKWNADGKQLKLPENKEDGFNPKTKNSLVTKACATSKDNADKLGRGMTQPVQWFDEFGFLKYNMIIYESAAPAALQAGLEAEKFGRPHCKMISTTPGDMTTEFGRDAFDFKNKCCEFNEDFYDWKISEVRTLLKKSSKNGFFHIIFNYRQLGRDNEYFEQCITQLGSNWFKIRREVLLQWISTADDSPFDAKDLEQLQETAFECKKREKTVYIDKYYPLHLYEKIDKMVLYILSSDVASGVSRDSSTIAIIDSRNKRCVGEFENNKVDTLYFSKIIHTIATTMCPNCLICIERNNVGSSVITNLLRTDVRAKMYYETTGSDIQEKVKDGRIVNDMSSEARNFGVWTDDKKREEMMELLSKQVHEYKERVCTPILSTQICGLVYNKRGRVDHTAEGHDDMVMAYLIGLWVYYYGKQLSRYGLVRMPDVDPSTGLTEQEAYMKMINEERIKQRNLENSFMQMVGDENFNSPKQAFKTLNDYYNEIDKEREAAHQEASGGTTNFEAFIERTNNNNNKNRTNMMGGMFNDSFSEGGFGEQLVDSILGDDF